MNRYEVGTLVRSTAGHDAGCLYVILKSEGAYIYVANGRNRKVDQPKKKKTRHVQWIARIYDVSMADDAQIRRILKDYKNDYNKEEENRRI